jgi:hypothetical protein
MHNRVVKSETLGEKCGIDREVINNFSGDSIMFILKNKKRIEFERKDNLLEIHLKGKLIKDYFKITGEKSNSYHVWGGRLYLDFKSFKNYISKFNEFNF